MIRLDTKLKRICAVIFALIFVLPVGSIALAKEVKFAPKPMRVQFVLDASGSMNQTDKERVSIELIKLMLDINGFGENQAGFVAYNSEIAAESAPASIALAEERGALKKKLDGIKRSRDTDIGLGLSRAYELLKAAPFSGNSFIIMISDGETELPSSKRTKRTKAQSDEDVKAVCARAAADGIPIYCVGMNVGFKDATDYLLDIASSSGGEYFSAASPSQLADILREIFGRYAQGVFAPLESSGGVYSIEIPKYAMETNVILLSGEDMRKLDVELSGANYDEQSSKHYRVFKLSAASGQTASLSGASKLKAYVSSAFALSGVMDVTQNGALADISVYFMNGAQRILDKTFYESLAAKLTVTKSEVGATQPTTSPASSPIASPITPPVTLSMTASENALHAQYAFPRDGEYTFAFECENEALKFGKVPFAFEYVKEKALPSPTQAPQDDVSRITLWRGQAQRIALAPSESVSITALRGTSVGADIEGTMLLLRPRDYGGSAIDLQIDGRDVKLVVNVVSLFEHPPALWRLAALVALIAAAGFTAFSMARKRNGIAEEKMIEPRKFAGSVVGRFIRTKSQNDILPLRWSLSKFSSRGKISLFDMLVVSDIHEALDESKRIWFTPGKDGQLLLSHRTSCTVLVDKRVLPKDETAVLNFGETFIITFEDGITELEMSYERPRRQVA